MTYLDVRPAHAQRVDSSLNARLGAGGIDDDVRARAEPALADEVLRVLLCADARALEASVGRVREGELQALVVDVDGDDLLRAVRLGHGAAQQPHGAGAEDDNRVAGLDGRLSCDVDGDGGGFDQGALLEAHVLRQLVAVVLGQSVVPSQCAVVGGCGGEGHVRAEVVLALLAPHAAAAGDAGLHRHAVTDLEGCDFVADFLDDAGGLVAEDHGLLDDEVADPAFDPVVHI